MGNYTVADLISELEDLDPEAEIRIAHQPSWPLREVLGGVVPQDVLDETDPDLYDVPDRKSERIVWLVANGHPSHDESPYASKRLWELGIW